MRLLLYSTCLFVSLANAGEGPNPGAPHETEQYAFLVGTWDCATRSMGPDGTIREGGAIWKGYFILDGWAIQDDWTALDGSGQPLFFGTNIRSFNAKLGKGECRWLPSGSLTWKHLISWQEGKTMVMEGEGEDQRGKFIDRNTFSNISGSRWSWKKDRSYDGGKTWFEGVSTIEATQRP